MVLQNPLLQPLLVLVEWKIPVRGLVLHQRITVDGIDRVDELIGRERAAALLTLVAVCVGIVAVWALALDIAVGEELVGLLIVVLLALYLHELAVVVELAEEVGRQFVVDGGGGAGINIK